MFRFGKRKPRSKVGKLIDKHGYTQEEFVSASGISRNTISRVCSDPRYVPSAGVLKKIMKAVRSLDAGAKADDYFDL
ncbi:helix-turn-helix transcriptional regulator [Peribacillus frigoritolerans]|jgi:transcriptional regulator with XRE-family HTH domain|uniref:helix-turn-helix domain-containing protein n=1 Tax=Peribacillus frigoritolerans TaxID=450367 RepID=UPI000710B3AD|nr:helix-turn-helix transcriptional regulator [Peribacillus frigoritolerans]KRF50539.1 XRE family transcriptional regulator [Bacillus sp. Soil745]PAW26652.1 transcriptional regulator [Peribacillus simplex]MCP1492820.1 transcriptional regulator with XRE-family HTH domain [Peribacillus frigoritolerans]MED3707935.1 helix-turn-helix transcriptional regulator [Peribacillus frigoritolerans]MED3891667.1 helix-turn-helix transcriptional regulator [Peribacillus frigoritolerans]